MINVACLKDGAWCLCHGNHMCIDRSCDCLGNQYIRNGVESHMLHISYQTTFVNQTILCFFYPFDQDT